MGRLHPERRTVTRHILANESRLNGIIFLTHHQQMKPQCENTKSKSTQMQLNMLKVIKSIDQSVNQCFTILRFLENIPATLM